jgi:hypothetical protein
MPKHLKEAGKIFKKKVESFYSKDDLRNKKVMSFNRNGERVDIGLMKLFSVITDKKLHVEKKHLIQNMGRVCEGLDWRGTDVIMMADDMTRI